MERRPVVRPCRRQLHEVIDLARCRFGRQVDDESTADVSTTAVVWAPGRAKPKDPRPQNNEDTRTR